MNNEQNGVLVGVKDQVILVGTTMPQRFIILLRKQPKPLAHLKQDKVQKDK